MCKECSLTIWISWCNVIAMQQLLLIDVNRVIVTKIFWVLMLVYTSRDENGKWTLRYKERSGEIALLK